MPRMHQIAHRMLGYPKLCHTFRSFPTEIYVFFFFFIGCLLLLASCLLLLLLWLLLLHWSGCHAESETKKATPKTFNHYLRETCFFLQIRGRFFCEFVMKTNFQQRIVRFCRKVGFIYTCMCIYIYLHMCIYGAKRTCKSVLSLDNYACISCCLGRPLIPESFDSKL